VLLRAVMLGGVTTGTRAVSGNCEIECFKHY
jgi:hypothetical protein